MMKLDFPITKNVITVHPLANFGIFFPLLLEREGKRRGFETDNEGNNSFFLHRL